LPVSHVPKQHQPTAAARQLLAYTAKPHSLLLCLLLLACTAQAAQQLLAFEAKPLSMLLCLLLLLLLLLLAYKAKLLCLLLAHLLTLMSSAHMRLSSGSDALNFSISGSTLPVKE
jgi:hypothetical protein